MVLSSPVFPRRSRHCSEMRGTLQRMVGASSTSHLASKSRTVLVFMGIGTCSLDDAFMLCNRPNLFAIAPMESAAPVVTFVSKAVLCDRGNAFASFSEDDFLFRGQAQHFRRVQFHFA